jgi:hypothetical protein
MHYKKHISRDRYPASLLARRSNLQKYTSHDRCLLLCEVTANTENTASSIVACWTVFTELLPGNALIKSVTSYDFTPFDEKLNRVTNFRPTNLNYEMSNISEARHSAFY